MVLLHVVSAFAIVALAACDAQVEESEIAALRNTSQASVLDEAGNPDETSVSELNTDTYNEPSITTAIDAAIAEALNTRGNDFLQGEYFSSA